MAGQYKYDNEGAQFLTFVLTFLLVALLPLTYSLVPGHDALGRAKGGKQSWLDAKGQKDEEVKRITRRSLANPRLSGKWVLLFMTRHGAGLTDIQSDHLIESSSSSLDGSLSAFCFIRSPMPLPIRRTLCTIRLSSWASPPVRLKSRSSRTTRSSVSACKSPLHLS